MVEAKSLSEKFSVPQFAVHRIIYRHGARAERILELTRERPELKELVCHCEPVLACELVYCLHHEWATSLLNLRNRTRLGAGPCQGMRCTAKAAAILARELDLSAAEALDQMLSFLERRWKGNRPVLEGKSLEEEELSQAAYLLVANLARLSGSK